jgi:acetyltransferase-like isoleucine patch superfamily enzyme
MLGTLKSWLRRVKHLPGLCLLEFNKFRLRSKGAAIADTAICSEVSLHGSQLAIGEFCSIGRVYIQAFDHITIGNCVVINDGVTLIAGSHDPDSEDYQFVTKPIVIKNHAWIAMNATVLPGVTIGEAAVVGAGSVVTRDVGDYEIVAGNPARRIRSRARVLYRYRPSYWFGPVAAWVAPGIYSRNDRDEKS